MTYIDIHTHLTHEKFAHDWEQVVQRAEAAGLEAIVVNGLETLSNRQVLVMAQKYHVIKPALGIYPVNAVHDQLPPNLPFQVDGLDVDAELRFIRSQAEQGLISAVGECGLDGHWVGPETYPRQEQVFEAFIDIAKANDLPLIIHTRKLEQRAIEILAHHRVSKVNFHCFGGRTKWAKDASEKYGWWFSIPANARSNQAFTKMLLTLPEERLLTETDAPYLAPSRGQRNEPIHVIDTVNYWAELKGWPPEQAASKVLANFQELMEPTPP